MDPLQHPVNAHVSAPLPAGFADWSDYYAKTRDYSKGPDITVINSDRWAALEDRFVNVRASEFEAGVKRIRELDEVDIMKVALDLSRTLVERCKALPCDLGRLNVKIETTPVFDNVTITALADFNCSSVCFAFLKLDNGWHLKFFDKTQQRVCIPIAEYYKDQATWVSAVVDTVEASKTAPHFIMYNMLACVKEESPAM